MQVAIDGKAAAVIAIADAPRETAAEAISALRELGVRPVMLSGDSRATAERVAAELGIDEVIAEVLPADKAAKVTELQQQGRKVAMVGDGVNDAPALAQADVGIAIGTGTDVAVETADVVLMRSDPLDVATAITISRGTVRKMHQNLWWAVGYNSLALPVAAGVFEPLGFVLRPEVGAISMAGSSIIVALNAVALKRLRLPDRAQREQHRRGRRAGRPRPAPPRGRSCVTTSGSRRSYRTVDAVGMRLRPERADEAPRLTLWLAGARGDVLRPAPRQAVRANVSGRWRRPGTGQRAEEVGGSLVHQAAGRVVGVDGHPADRVDGQPLFRVLPGTHGGEQFDGLADVAQRLRGPSVRRARRRCRAPARRCFRSAGPRRRRPGLRRGRPGSTAAPKKSPSRSTYEP